MKEMVIKEWQLEEFIQFSDGKSSEMRVGMAARGYQLENSAVKGGQVKELSFKELQLRKYSS